jgi:hypothetical protein
MGGYCDYTLFTPALFPLIPPCTSLSCNLNVAFTPNDTKARQIMTVISNYYGLNWTGFDTEEQMVNYLSSKNDTKSGFVTHTLQLIKHFHLCSIHTFYSFTTIYLEEGIDLISLGPPRPRL